MTTSKIQLTEGSGKNAATYSFSEDAVTKDVSRTVFNKSDGTEIGTSSNPIQVALASTDNLVYGVSSIVTSTSASSVLAAPGASLRNYITSIKVTNAAANAVIVDIKDSGGVVLDTGYAAASGGGWSTSFPVPLKQPSTNTSVDVVPRSQGSVLVTINGFKAA